MEKEEYANCRGAKLIEVLAVEVNEGAGNTVDPIRRVLYLYSKSGKLLAQSKDEERKFTQGDFMILEA
jgi:hypothetical protein